MIGAITDDLRPCYRVSDLTVVRSVHAAAGILAYWRVETDPVSLTAYTLPAGAAVYAEAGTWRAGDIARLVAPFLIEIEIDTLVSLE